MDPIKKYSSKKGGAIGLDAARIVWHGGVVWADVTLDGKRFTTNKVFMDVLPYSNMAKTAEITPSHDQASIKHLVDGKTILINTTGSILGRPRSDDYKSCTRELIKVKSIAASIFRTK